MISDCIRSKYVYAYQSKASRKDLKMSASPAKKTKKAAAAPRKVAAHPKYGEMITEALKALKNRKGTSRQQLMVYVKSNYNVGDNCSKHMKTALKRLLSENVVVQVKGQGFNGSFKLQEKTKAVAPKKPAAKKPAAKKTVAKKATPKKASAKKAAVPAKKSATKAKPSSAKKAAKKPAAKKVVKKTAAKKTPKKKVAAKKSAKK